MTTPWIMPNNLGAPLPEPTYFTSMPMNSPSQPPLPLPPTRTSGRPRRSAGRRRVDGRGPVDPDCPETEHQCTHPHVVEREERFAEQTSDRRHRRDLPRYVEPGVVANHGPTPGNEHPPLEARLDREAGGGDDEEAGVRQTGHDHADRTDRDRQPAAGEPQPAGGARAHWRTVVVWRSESSATGGAPMSARAAVLMLSSLRRLM